MSVRCGNCDWTGDESETKEIKDLWERVAPGDTFPSGECPKCGALAIPVEEIEPAVPLTAAERLDAIEQHLKEIRAMLDKRRGVTT